MVAWTGYDYLCVVLACEADSSLGDTLTVAVPVALTFGAAVMSHITEVTLTLVGCHTVSIWFTLLLAVRLALVAANE